jgi:penicillin amidase
MRKRVLPKLLKIAGIVLAMIIVAAVVAGVWFVTRPWPQTNGELSVAGLRAKVTITRDQFGIPNIYAENDHDLFFAQGYVHAQDRLFQLEFNRRVGSGRLSEIAGPAALGTDKYSRVMGLRRIAEKSWPMLDADSQAVLEAYAQGINAYIDSHRNNLPVEFTLLNFTPEPWTPLDSLSWANMMGVLNAINFSYEMFRAQVIAKMGEKKADELLPVWDAANPEVVPKSLEKESWARLSWFKDDRRTAPLPFEDFLPGAQTFGCASGAWAVSGKYTASGKPILTSDAHMTLSLPCFWYEMGLHGGNYNVTGISIPALPFIVIGHNEKIGWAFTNMNPDVQDLYMEKVDDPKNPTRYIDKGVWRDFEKKTETINVKGKPPYVMNLLFSRHGPLVTDLVTVTDQDKDDYLHRDKFEGKWSVVSRDRWTGPEPLALRWAMNDGSVVIRSFLLLNRAQNWNEFRNALRYWDSLSQNFVYADVDGNIGYQAAARAPIRGPKHSGAVPVPGWTGEYEWRGYVPFEKLPSLFNPSSGYVAVANNKTVSDDYPYKLTYDWFDPGYRARRLNERLRALIASGRPITAEDMTTLKADTYSYAAAGMYPYLSAITTDDERQAAAMEILKRWDFRFDTDSVGASIFAAWYNYMNTNVFDDKLEKAQVWGVYLPLKRLEALVGLLPDAKSPWFDDLATPNVEARDDMVKKSFGEAVAWLGKNYGDDPTGWKLGRIQTVRLKHVLFGDVPFLGDIFNGGKTLPFPGSFASLTFAYSFTTPPLKFKVEYAPNERQLLLFDDWDKMGSAISHGESAQLFHPNREDQTELWANLQYHPMPFTNAAVESAAKAKLVLSPAGGGKNDF